MTATGNDPAAVRLEQPRTPRRVTFWPAVAAAVVAVLAIAGGVVATQHRGGSTTKTGPRSPIDGKGSMMLPVAATPSSGLDDGQTVRVHGEGFQPDESLGVAMCAIEASAPEHRGIDACDIAGYASITADPDGSVNLNFTVRRVINAGRIGRIDCAKRPERCLVAVGAMGDYDRSGGMPVSFDESLPPLSQPTFGATPASGLADGQEVTLRGSGYPANAPYSVRQCTDRGFCADLTVPGMSGSASSGTAEDSSDVSLPTMDASGSFSATVHVQRHIAGDFLRGGVSGQEVDCATAACSLSIVTADLEDGSYLEAPDVALGFDSAGPSSPKPTMSVSPTEALQVGAVVTISLAGAEPASTWLLMQCAEGQAASCMTVGGPQAPQGRLVADPEGAGQVQVTVSASDDCGGSGRCGSSAGLSIACGSPVPVSERGSCLLRLVPAGATGGLPPLGAAPINQRVPDEVRVCFAP